MIVDLGKNIFRKGKSSWTSLECAYTWERISMLARFVSVFAKDKMFVRHFKVCFEWFDSDENKLLGLVVGDKESQRFVDKLRIHVYNFSISFEYFFYFSEDNGWKNNFSLEKVKSFNFFSEKVCRKTFLKKDVRNFAFKFLLTLFPVFIFETCEKYFCFLKSKFVEKLLKRKR